MERASTFLKAALPAMLLSAGTVSAATLTWDAGGGGGAITNGAGAWLGAGLWNNAAAAATWTSGDDAIFGGPATAGGAVTLASPTTVNSLTFNSFTGTYTLGTAGQAITLNTGLAMGASSAAVTLVSPVTLGGAQTWTNNSASTLQLNTPGLTNAGFPLTIDGSGPTTFGVINNTAVTLSGSGDLIKNGSGLFALGGTNAGFSGNVTINGGTMRVNSIGSIGSGNLTLNGGVYEEYWSANFTRTLGSGAGQVQLLGGVSGFSENGATGMNVILNNNAAFEVVWGSAFFAPSTLVLQAASAQNSSTLNFQNKIDLNGADRTVFSSITTGNQSGSATLSGVIRNSTGTAGLIKTGSGLLYLTAVNTYNGATTVNQGNLTATVTGALPGYATPGNVVVAANATIGVRTGAWTAGNIDSLRGAATWSASTSRLGLDTTSGSFTYSSNITEALSIHKLGNNNLTLSGNSSYTGSTILTGGSLVPDSANALGSGDITFNGGTLQYTANSASIDYGSRIKNSAAAILLNTNGQNVTLSGVDATNTAGITKSGAGTLTLAGGNAYTGATTINQGLVVVSGASVLGGAAGSTADANNIVFGSNLNSGVLEFSTAANLGPASQIRFRNTGGTAGQGGALKYVGTTSQTVSKTIFCDTSIGIRLESDSVGGAVTFNGAFSQTNRALYLGGSGTGANQMNIAFTGNGTLTKRDGGSWILGAVNTYTGATTVTGGTLVVNGSIPAAGLVNVSGGATIGGSGSAGQVNVADGFLSPGGAADNSFAVANLTLDPAAKLVIGLDDPTLPALNDSVLITTGLTLAGQINLHAQPGGSGYNFLTAAPGTQWQIMTYAPGNLSLGTVTIGTAPALASGLGWGLDTTNDGSVYVYVTPEPSASVLVGLGALLLLRRRRAA